jgi:hypothetical protein
LLNKRAVKWRNRQSLFRYTPRAVLVRFLAELRMYFPSLFPDTYAAWTACRAASTQSTQSECYEDDIKDKILAASLPFVVELGWSRKALGAGAQAAGYPGVTHGLFPRGGADLVHYFQRTSNLQLVEVLKEVVARFVLHRPQQSVVLAGEGAARCAHPAGAVRREGPAEPAEDDRAVPEPVAASHRDHVAAAQRAQRPGHDPGGGRRHLPLRRGPLGGCTAVRGGVFESV